MKPFKFNLTPLGILQIVTILIVLRCCNGNIFYAEWKIKKLAYLERYWLDLAQVWYIWAFWILNPKPRTKLLSDVILVLRSSLMSLSFGIFEPL